MTGNPEAPVAWGFRVVGRVQGVGFRFWTAGVARELGLRGWVRNGKDGSVEMVAEGAEDALAALEKRLAVGPASSKVVRVVRLPAAGALPAQGFEIRR